VRGKELSTEHQSATGDDFACPDGVGKGLKWVFFQNAEKARALSLQSILDRANKPVLLLGEGIHGGGGRGSSARSRIGFWQQGQVGVGETTDITVGGV
jgi:hypothetical protein